MDQPHFHEGVFVVVDAFVVDAHGHVDAGAQELVHGRNAVAHLQIAAGVMGDRCVAFGQKGDVFFRNPDHMAEHGVAVNQPGVIQHGQQRTAMLLEAVGALMRCLQRVDMDGNAAQFGRAVADAAHQFVGSAVRPTGSQQDAGIGAVVFGVQMFENLEKTGFVLVGVVLGERLGQRSQVQRQGFQEILLVAGESVDVADGRRIGETNAGFAIGADGLFRRFHRVRPQIVPTRVMQRRAARLQVAHGGQRGGQIGRQGDAPGFVQQHVFKKIIPHACLDAGDSVTVGVGVDQTGH